MRILIVEDEPKAAALLKKGLSENNYIVDVAHDGEQGIFLAGTNDFDLLILDVMLPKFDGWTVLTTLRRQGVQTPVLFLTARDSAFDRVKGLEMGADDYLVKPYTFSELLARIRIILRRSQIKLQDVFVVGDLSIDVVRHKAMRGNQHLDLTPKEFALLSLLARRVGEVVTRTVMAEQAWDMNFDSDTNVVTVAMGRLRQKVDDDFENKLIHTVRGIGYVLEDRSKK
jgi:two-component system copper resistance phosphate regulon response regulator CusR